MLSFHPIPGLPEIRPGDDLVALLEASLAAMPEGRVNEGDVFVIAQKIVSKSENRYVDLRTVEPRAEALALAKRCHKDARFVELVLRESTEVVRVAGDPGTDIRVVHCQLESPRGPAGTVICQIDAARGYITPLIQELDAQGNLSREWTCQNYFRAGNTELWFPKVCVYREKSTKNPNALPTVERYEFSPDGVMLNVEIPPERFAVPLDVGEILLDGGDPASTNYTTAKELRISLDDAENIPGIAGLRILRVGDEVPRKKKP